MLFRIDGADDGTVWVWCSEGNHMGSRYWLHPDDEDIEFDDWIRACCDDHIPDGWVRPGEVIASTLPPACDTCGERSEHEVCS